MVNKYIFWFYFGATALMIFLFPINENSHRITFADFTILSLTCKQAKVLILVFVSAIGLLYVKLKNRKINNSLAILHFIATILLGLIVSQDVDQRYTSAIMSNTSAEINLHDLALFNQDTLKNRISAFLNSLKYKTNFMILVQMILVITVIRKSEK